MRVKNSKGDIFYGMHFYPGVAEYGRDTRIFLNENTIRKMGPTFAGRPVYVQHVDDVESNLDDLRKEADGWVVESFFNDADGKHWVKFIVCSEQGRQAVNRGWRLSNCYLPKTFSNGGTWNGVSYNKEVTSGEYEHLAIVPNPRYEESVIMTPDEFKAYNEAKKVELFRLANNNIEGDDMLFFKKSKVDNSKEIADMVVMLPKSGRSVSIMDLVTEADKLAVDGDKPRLANDADFVTIEGDKVLVSDLVKAFNAKKNEDEKEEVENEDDEKEEVENEDGEEVENEDDVEVENEDDEIEAAKDKQNKKKNKKKNKKAKNSVDTDEDEDEDYEAFKAFKARRKNAKEAANRLKNAHNRVTDYDDETPAYNDPKEAVERGKARYG